jgi:predicted acetyltransferase
MNGELLKALPEHIDVINNLMQFYMYDFSEYMELAVEANGLFAPYDRLEDYWMEESAKFPYLIKQEGKYIGFVLVRFIESPARNYFSIAEFFVMKKYRRTGIGKTIAMQVFDLHRGQWQVYQKENNKPAQAFWQNVTAAYTKGRFTERTADGRVIQDFENG